MIIALLKSTKKKWSTFTTLSKTGFWTFISKSNLSYPYMFVCVCVFCDSGVFFWYLERDEGTFNLTCFIFKVFSSVFFSFLDTTHSLSWSAIREAMFLKAAEVPDIRLKRTPFRLRRGSLHTLKYTNFNLWNIKLNILPPFPTGLDCSHARLHEHRTT